MNDNYPYITKYKMDWFLHSLINHHLNSVIERYSKVIGLRLDFSYNQNSERYKKDYSCLQQDLRKLFKQVEQEHGGNDSNLLIVFYVQIMPDDFVMQLHRF